MSKRILLIESDEPFARSLQNAMAAGGFDAVTATDSEQGMTLARKSVPDLIIVCVEAQPTNGYMLCTRLKKDDKLKEIPVILTSANATPDSFEKHKKLKTRAEDYLIKPFAPAVMVQKASELLGVSLEVGAEDDIVTVEDEPLGIGDLVSEEDEPIHLSDSEAAEARGESEAEAEPLVDEEVEEVLPLEVEADSASATSDEDLQMFDRAFDALGSPGDAKPAKQAPASSRPALRARGESVDDALDALGEPADHALSVDDETVIEDEALDAALPEGLGHDELDAQVEALQQELVATRKGRTTGAAGANELHSLREELAKREAANKALQQRADTLGATVKKLERELAQAREELKAAGGNDRIAELEAELSQLREQHEVELTGVKDELAKAKADLEALSEEAEEHKRQAAEAQADAARNEERAVKAYQKIKLDDRAREKTRKALQIALQLLEDAPAADPAEAAAEKHSA